MNWASFGYGNQVIEQDEEYVKNFEGFEKVLNKLIPEQIGFKKFAIRRGEVFLDTDHEQFFLEASSGGLASIVLLAWEIYLCSLFNKDGFVAIIDEPENHLHASLQRSLLPNLIEAFPKTQFIVSTHSPLIVGSVKDSNVYALTFSEEGVVSNALDIEDKAQTASEVLQDVLGVPFTMPIWVEDKLNQITEKYSSTDFSKSEAIAMRDELSRIGLEELVPTALIQVIDGQHDKAK